MTTVYVEQRGIWQHVVLDQDRNVVTVCGVVVADGRPVELIEPRPLCSRCRERRRP
jgi:hypothetical protein